MSALLVRHGAHLRQRMYSLDWYFISLIAVYVLICLCFWSEIPARWSVLLENLSFAAICLSIVYFLSDADKKWKRVLREFYVIPFVYPMYAQIFAFLPYIRSTLYDTQLIALDHALCGTHPTQWLQQFSHPLLTEYLQVCYVAFFFLPSIHGIILFRAKRFAEFELFSRLMVFSFFVSYLAYFAFPAVGPRFTLHSFTTLSTDLPGLWVTDFLRERVNQGGGILVGAVDPAAIVNRDCMPSGHTMMTLVNMILTWKFRTPGKWIFTLVGSSLIVATLYLRYHYVVDVLAGAACALLMLAAEPRVDAWLKKRGLVSSIQNSLS